MRPEFVRNAAKAYEPPPGDTPPAQQDNQPAPERGPKSFKLAVFDEEREVSIDEVAQLADMTVEEVQANSQRAIRYAQKELAATRKPRTPRRSSRVLHRIAAPPAIPR